MDIGRKIYYGKSNGLIIWDKGEMTGSVVETTFEEDKITMPILSLIHETELGILQLAYGQFEEEFKTCYKYSIDLEQNLVFDYSFPIPPPPLPTIEQQFTEMKENQLILMDVMATMYEDMLAKGTV